VQVESDEDRTPTIPGSEDQWTEWALVVLGGNLSRAAAAGRAAVAAQSAGASADEAFAAAKSAYAAAHEPADLEGGRDASPRAIHLDEAPSVLRPSGARRLGLSLLGALALGVLLSIAKYGTDGALPATVIAGGVFGVWYLLCLRPSVRVAGSSVTVQGPITRRELRRLDVRTIVVQPSTPWWNLAGGAGRQFIASIVGEDSSTLFVLRQGAWTRADIDRVGAAIGVRVAESLEPSFN